MIDSKIILVGAGASGKDFLRKRFQDRGFKFAVTHVTRPIRPTEENGIDCHFVSKDEFTEMILEGQLIEYNIHNGWYYGTSVATFEECDVFTMTPSGLSQLSKGDRARSFVIYLDIPEEIRRSRLDSRVMPGDTTERRLATDMVDFSNFTDYDLRIVNEDF